jgi:hypothetical protein
MQLWSHPSGNGGVVVLLSAQGVDYDIGLAWMTIDSKIVIINQLQPSSLSQIQIQLSEDVLVALVVIVYLTSMTNVIVPPSLESTHNAANSKS